MCVYTHRALRTELSHALNRHPLTPEMVTRSEWKCLVASTTIVRFFALLRLFSTPDSDPAPDVVRSFPFLGPAYTVGTISVSPSLSLPRPRSRPHYSLAFLRSPPSSLSFSLLPDRITVHVPFPAPDSVHISVSAPDSDPDPDPVRSFPSLRSAYPLGAMCVYRHRVLRAELSSARKRQPLSAVSKGFSSLLPIP